MTRARPCRKEVWGRGTGPAGKNRFPGALPGRGESFSGVLQILLDIPERIPYNGW